ncbi:MAG: purine-nucleoside phosphorylase [Bacteroidota bacterium]|nr:purine-nucleoside phosphorylase [Bacteroidota bacterium]MDP4251265.1 purine-nucleoside phosphorylase [Bacteroidota bacterium]
MTENEIRKLELTAAFIKKYYPFEPSVGIVLGSGIGNLAREIEVEYQVEYSAIPDFPVSTVKGHSGELIFGKLAGKRVVAMAGRFHYYEGYDVDQVVFPVRLMKYLGVKTLLLSNAAGGMQQDFQVGDLMLITDHISLFTVNPLIGTNQESIGPRFPDMSEPYKKLLIEKARIVAREEGIELKEGIYAGVTGPSFETRAEYQLLHLAGAAAVGMSTVQEAIAAVHLGLDVFAMSIITDLGIRKEANIITHEEVLEAARLAEPRLTAIFKGLIGSI